ncbi:hypothetical protein PC128_g13879 [Phytophthora cactorum]|uniref:Uncharacterized protein n=1 Tax=Phytophthora cactorum TaxID=29920 RepID=A0A8T1E5W3_9STRA|nr:hypothetical protein PC115_g4452 [Phytophthora cactorum]KAG2949703.1 hypothetical protein PC117_g5029 [Phytophthora cactorum]KAG3017297.1 hypothetical protein PC120_g11099 [Phytophthora cactorum]KAG3091786.1 hypothetical protein PC121_g3759 [Phytophthora cactorum]KAG3184045.1 hypothetical protein C6341_g5186 [Phytophthora cactorum]
MAAHGKKLTRGRSIVELPAVPAVLSLAWSFAAVCLGPDSRPPPPAISSSSVQMIKSFSIGWSCQLIHHRQ